MSNKFMFSNGTRNTYKYLILNLFTAKTFSKVKFFLCCRDRKHPDASKLT